MVLFSFACDQVKQNETKRESEGKKGKKNGIRKRNFTSINIQSSIDLQTKQGGLELLICRLGQSKKKQMPTPETALRCETINMISINQDMSIDVC